MLTSIPSDRIGAVAQRLECAEWVPDPAEFVTKFPLADYIVLKFPDHYPDTHVGASYRAAWAIWKPFVEPLIEVACNALFATPYATSKIMFARLLPGGVIPMHVDSNKSSVVPHKVHIPIVTDPDVHFEVGDRTHHLPVGAAYELNNLLPHSVRNSSGKSRIHLIFDCYRS